MPKLILPRLRIMALTAFIVSLGATSCSGPTSHAVSATQLPTSTASASASVQSRADVLESKRQAVEKSLETLLAVTKRPTGDQVRSALTGSGNNASSVEVTATSTPTGQQADTLQASVLVGADCVMSNIRGGVLSMTTLPALSTGRCFVGGDSNG